GVTAREREVRRRFEDEGAHARLDEVRPRPLDDRLEHEHLERGEREHGDQPRSEAAGPTHDEEGDGDDGAPPAADDRQERHDAEPNARRARRTHPPQARRVGLAHDETSTRPAARLGAMPIVPPPSLELSTLRDALARKDQELVAILSERMRLIREV